MERGQCGLPPLWDYRFGLLPEPCPSEPPRLNFRRFVCNRCARYFSANLSTVPKTAT